MSSTDMAVICLLSLCIIAVIEDQAGRIVEAVSAQCSEVAP